MCFLFLGYVGWAQSQYTYYLVKEAGTSLEPQSKVTNPDGSLTLVFSNSTLNSFFQNKTIFQYEKAFPTAKLGYLTHVFQVSLSDSNLVTLLSNLPHVNFAERIPEEFPMIHIPNDYVDPSGTPSTQLNLIRAPKAWDISTGNPSIIVGIADDDFQIDHEDLQNQIVYHTENSTQTDQHGTKVAGMVGAETNNSKGIAAVGYNVKLFTKEIIGANSLYELAQESGVRVINYSYGGCTYSSVQAELYRAIRQDFGVLVVASAGNGDGDGDGDGDSTCGNPNNYVYPASYDHVLSVSSVGHTFPTGNDDPTWGMIEWRDVHQSVYDPLNIEKYTHQHNDKVDILAPGYAVWTTGENNTYKKTWGTSLSSPMVAGAAALVLSTNPSLSANQVENILKNTADDIFWIPYNQPYIGKLGSGRLNVFRAVKTTQCMNVLNPKLNLVVRDTNEDVGNQPNNQSTVFNRSEDIWVRNQNDGRYNETHQNVEYDPSNPNYVYIRVTNYGCKTSSGNDELRLYWSVAGTSQS